MPVGHGDLNFGLFANNKQIGVNAEFMRRFNKTWSGFARGEVMMNRSQDIDWSAIAGLRGKW